jgi:hypothetical protein
MDSGMFKASTVIGVGASLALHAGVATWLAVAPPTMTVPQRSGEEGVEIVLGDVDAQDPVARAKALEDLAKSAPPLPPPVPPEQPPTPEAKPPEPVEPEPEAIDLDEIILGIDKSDAPKDTPAFLGTNEPTPHAAPMSEVEQPALTTKPAAAPGPPGESAPVNEPLPVGPKTDVPPTPPTPPAEPAPAESPAENPAERQPESPAENATPATTPEASPGELPLTPPADALPADAPPEEAAPGPLAPAQPAVPPSPPVEPSPDPDGKPLAPLLEVDPFGGFMFMMPGGGIIVLPARPEREATAPPASTAAASLSPSTAPQARPQVSPTAPPQAGGGERSRPGEVAGKESAAFTVKKTQDYRKNGKPLAPEGIEVTTFDPDLSILSTVTGSVRNPVIELRFGPDGKVKSAKFKNGLDSGRKDWDEPILHAMHRWTIGGEKFKELLKENPNREIVMTIRMILTR